MSSASLTVSHRVHNKPLSRQPITTMTVPAYISSPKDPTEILTYALIDSQSDKSYIVQEIVGDSIFTSRVKRKLRVSTITSKDQVHWCDCISNLQVRGFNPPDSETIEVNQLYSLDSIPANRDHIPTPKTAAAWPHLESIKDKVAPLQTCEVGMIIGFSCSIASLH